MAKIYLHEMKIPWVAITKNVDWLAGGSYRWYWKTNYKTASNINLRILQHFQSKLLRAITNTPPV